MKKHIVMVDYCSVCDEDGKPIGHGCKVGNEYYDYISAEFEVIQYVNRDMLPYIINPGKTAFAVPLRRGVGKCRRILSNLRNMLEVYRKENNSILWFYAPDMYFFIFALFMRKGSHKLIVNVFEEYRNNRMKHYIFQKALCRMDRVFVTNRNLLKGIPQGILIPDYAYRKEQYDAFLRLPKRERVICLGTMNEKKLLKEAVKAFAENGYPLHIAGQFVSEEFYHYLCSVKTDNVIIENRYVDTNEYYSMLGGSKYCLIPYDADFYKNRTSGVLQECVFVGTTPVSHKEILDFADVPGVGYEEISELAEFSFSERDDCFAEKYQLQRDEFYRYDAVREKVLKAISL